MEAVEAVEPSEPGLEIQNQQRSRRAGATRRKLIVSRLLFRGDIGDPIVLRGFAIMALLTALAIWWAARSFRNAAA